MPGDHLSPRMRRRLARSPYAPLPGDKRVMLRTDILARLLVERLLSLGPTSENEVLDAIEVRAPGRGPEVVTGATRGGLVRRVQVDDDVMLGAVGAPQTLAA